MAFFQTGTSFWMATVYNPALSGTKSVMYPSITRDLPPSGPQPLPPSYQVAEIYGRNHNLSERRSAAAEQKLASNPFNMMKGALTLKTSYSKNHIGH